MENNNEQIQDYNNFLLNQQTQYNQFLLNQQVQYNQFLLNQTGGKTCSNCR